MSRSLLFLVGALVAFVLCFLEATGVVSGVNYEAWLAAGLASFTASHLP